MAAILQTTFSKSFSINELLHSFFLNIEISPGLLLRVQLTISSQWFSLMLNRPYTIIWTNDVPFHSHIYVSQDLNELTHHPSLWHAMHHWSLSSLVEVMACRLFGDKPLPAPIMTYHPDTLPELKRNLNQNANIFCHENDLENPICHYCSGSNELNDHIWNNNPSFLLHSPIIEFRKFNGFKTTTSGQWKLSLTLFRQNLGNSRSIS